MAQSLSTGAYRPLTDRLFAGQGRLMEHRWQLRAEPPVGLVRLCQVDRAGVLGPTRAETRRHPWRRAQRLGSVADGRWQPLRRLVKWTRRAPRRPRRPAARRRGRLRPRPERPADRPVQAGDVPGHTRAAVVHARMLSAVRRSKASTTPRTFLLAAHPGRLW